MADTRRYLPNQHLDLAQILQESKNRWLRPAEICEILRNYQNFELTTDPPVRPPAGSLYLFDRKALRYFRKDGHRWRKKKDGKTVKEAHEKLKAGSVDVLHCYYAHGEDNANFQRRSYWMLDTHLQHIVLVHYRNVEEANSAACMAQKSFASTPVQTSFASTPVQTSFASSPIQTSFASSPVQTSFASSPNRVDLSGQTLSTEFEDVDSRRNAGTSSVEQPMLGSIFHNASLLPQQVGGFPESFRDPSSMWHGGPKFDHGAGLSVLHRMDGSTRNEHSMHGQNLFVEAPNRADFITNKLTDSRVDVHSGVKDVTCEDRLTTNIDVQIISAPSQREDQVPKEHDFNVLHPQVQDYSDTQIVVMPSNQVGENYRDGGVRNEPVELKKLDSFGRWMDKEIGVDCDDSLMASDSGNYWNTFDAESGDKEVSSLSHHMQLNVDSLGPSLSQEQLFSISDFSPDWAYSGTETKVLIVGSFVGSKKDSADTNWGCMFGEIEVSAEIISNNAIRCQTPLHAPGRVPFYVTGRNRLACSEIREFEYRKKPIGIAINSLRDDELRYQIQLAKLLSLGSERKWLICAVPDCDKCKLKSSIFSMRGNSESDWVTIDGASVACKSDHLSRRDVLIQNLLKDRLCEWLVCKIHEGGKVPHVLDNEGQGVLHLTAALGYEWAIGPIIAAGVSPNFRDARGRTGLHWASYFGREETVIALLRLGAAPGAVEDPTSIFPGGQTAADLASSRGHKGIAGYLAEADLTSHLELLTMNENIMNNVIATIAAENANHTAEVAAFNVAVDKQHSLKSPLTAVRKSAHAAARIQESFRARSFRQRQLTKSRTDVSEVQSQDLVARHSLKRVQKFAHYEDYLHVAAALKIQQNYRGWKGRKDYLKIRDRIVKIQAHVRGHQVRKNYKKVLWSVGILEKVILRWRRRGTGLRGFRVEKPTEDASSEVKKNDDYEFLSVGRKQKFAGVEKALARVQSMARHPEAREQYMRLLSNFEKLEMADGENQASNHNESSNKKVIDEVLLALNEGQ